MMPDTGGTMTDQLRHGDHIVLFYRDAPATAPHGCDRGKVVSVSAVGLVMMCVDESGHKGDRPVFVPFANVAMIEVVRSLDDDVDEDQRHPGLRQLDEKILRKR